MAEGVGSAANWGPEIGINLNHVGNCKQHIPDCLCLFVFVYMLSDSVDMGG